MILIQNIVKRALDKLGLPSANLHFEYPEDSKLGDYTTNVALVFGKKANRTPKELAAEIVATIEQEKLPEIKKVEVAGPGFINFYFSRAYFAQQLTELLAAGSEVGRGTALKSTRAIFEYTDPNPFKELHIGHLMSNTIGESLSRLAEFAGATVRRVCYQGDVGLQIAKAVWGMKNSLGLPAGNPMPYLGQCYARGSAAYEADEKNKSEIDELNKKIYNRSDAEVNKLYDWGKGASLAAFGEIYAKLGTNFDEFFFESETGEFGKRVVEDGLTKGVFEKSDSAVIFRGEQYGLHTRVFINKHGLPTYEAKELGLAKIKHDRWPYDLSVIVTGNEIRDYFQVLLKALSLVFPDLAPKTKHVPHGMLRLPSGKMSSREGTVITAENLLDEVGASVRGIMSSRDLDIPSEQEKQIASDVAVGAIKYSILKQAIGRDIIFDLAQSLSLEGDSGPYLQYAYTRAVSVLNKAGRSVTQVPPADSDPNVTELERLLLRFPEVVARAWQDYAPQQVVTYLTALASAFNHFYATNKILNSEFADYRLVLTQVFARVMQNGLWLLGIPTPERM